MTKNSGKIIGGFLAGVGIITYIVASGKSEDIKTGITQGAKKLAEVAEEKAGDVKEKSESLLDHIMNFAVENRKTISDAANYLLNNLAKKS